MKRYARLANGNVGNYNMNNKEPGYIYILTNPSFREDLVKIGKNSRHMNVHSKELDNKIQKLPLVY